MYNTSVSVLLHTLSLKVMFLNLNEGANECAFVGSCNSYVKQRRHTYVHYYKENQFHMGSQLLFPPEALMNFMKFKYLFEKNR